MSDRYSELSDDELILRMRDGDGPVVDHIMDRYKGMVRKKAGSMYILGAEPEDLIQEGMIGLFKAVRDYDMGRDASFSTFAMLCVSRQMYNAIQAAGRQKHMQLNSYISLCADRDDKNGPEQDMLENAVSTTETNPEQMLIEKENVEAIEKALEEKLSSLEKQVLELSMTGMGYLEISKVLGIDEKSTDNALQRARAKVRKLLF